MVSNWQQTSNVITIFRDHYITCRYKDGAVTSKNLPQKTKDRQVNCFTDQNVTCSITSSTLSPVSSTSSSSFSSSLVSSSSLVETGRRIDNQDKDNDDYTDIEDPDNEMEDQDDELFQSATAGNLKL